MFDKIQYHIESAWYVLKMRYHEYKGKHHFAIAKETKQHIEVLKLCQGNRPLVIWRKAND